MTKKQAFGCQKPQNKSAAGGFTFAMLLCGPLAAAPVSALNC